MNGSIELLDEEEFERNSRRMGYSEWIVKNARVACDEVMNRFERGEFPFDYQRQVEQYQRIKRNLKAHENKEDIYSNKILHTSFEYAKKYENHRR